MATRMVKLVCYRGSTVGVCVRVSNKQHGLLTRRRPASERDEGWLKPAGDETSTERRQDQHLRPASRTPCIGPNKHYRTRQTSSQTPNEIELKWLASSRNACTIIVRRNLKNRKHSCFQSNDVTRAAASVSCIDMQPHVCSSPADCGCMTEKETTISDYIIFRTIFARSTYYWQRCLSSVWFHTPSKIKFPHCHEQALQQCDCCTKTDTLAAAMSVVRCCL